MQCSYIYLRPPIAYMFENVLAMCIHKAIWPPASFAFDEHIFMIRIYMGHSNLIFNRKLILITYLFQGSRTA